MVEQTRQPKHVVSLQAGPGDVDTLFDVNLRISDQSARIFGRQLAAIGDQLDRERASRQPNWFPAPLHMLRPAQALTRTIYRDVHLQFWGFRGASVAVKSWMASTGQGAQGAEARAALESSFRPVTSGDWTRGALLTAALVAALILAGASWLEWKA
ncbi:bcl-2-interacting killer [Aulostomus maculatus]